MMKFFAPLRNTANATTAVANGLKRSLSKLPTNTANSAIVQSSNRSFSTVSATPTSLPTAATSAALKALNEVYISDGIIEKMVKELSPGVKKCLEHFLTGGMSYGSISLEAHMTIAEAVNRIAMAIHNVSSMEELNNLPYLAGPMSNSGEGGELPKRNGTVFQSLIGQVASGRFGVNIKYLANKKVLEIKVNQGAKPGIGGELPGHKVTIEIAQARLTTPGITLASPPPHQDIYSIEDLKRLIQALRSANPRAWISVKLAARDGIGVIAAGVAKCGADIINIAGPGGTGAAPLTAKYEFVHAWETALAEVHQTLTAQGLRSSVTLRASGGIQTGLDCFKAMLLGADDVEVGTEPLVAMGCVMAEVCHDGSCPTGIATQNQKIIDEKFKGKPEDVARILIATAKSLNVYLEKYGFSDPKQAVGRTDLLRVKDKAPLTGLEKLLDRPVNPFQQAFGKIAKQEGSSYSENQIIAAISVGESQFEIPASSLDASFGARIGYLTQQRDFAERFFAQPVVVKFNGLATGQNLGFAAPGNLTLIANNTNDGTGSSLDGAEIFVKSCVGNQSLYGATRGWLAARYLGDRALVRNSGADAITEWAGEMLANFMTGGSLTILGAPWHYPMAKITVDYQQPILLRQDVVGPNFGASFSGGQIFLPKKLYEELLAKGYLHPTARQIKPELLDEDELYQLVARINKFAAHIPSPWIKVLLSQVAVLKEAFIKLDPITGQKKSSAVAKPVTPALTEGALDPKTLASIATPKKSSAKVTTEQPSLYDPTVMEKDACGTGAVVRLDGQSCRDVTDKLLIMLERLMKRGSESIDSKTGDGCGITWYGLLHFFQKLFPNLQLQKNNYCIAPMFTSADTATQAKALELFQQLLAKEGLAIAGERAVPTKRELLGYLGRQQETALVQFVILKPVTQTVEEFEKALIRTRLRFELAMQEANYTSRPHLVSASAYNVIYKSLVKEDKFAQYYTDFSDPDFQASAGVPHARFATNTLPTVKNIQPLPKFANNGENNALQLIVRLLTHDPAFKKLLGVESVNLSGFSDSHIMSIYMDMLHLLGFSAEEIVASTINPYDPNDNIASQFYNLFAVSFEGPNGSVVVVKDEIVIVRDKNGFRPQRGVVNAEMLYSGSELGAVDIDGSVFDLQPGRPLVVDLATGTYALHKPRKEILQWQQAQLNGLKTCKPETVEKEPIVFSQAELDARKLRAGWNEETDKMVMKPLFNRGAGATSSMADQGPMEALVKGSFFYIGNFFKALFSQVTNPALASKQEGAYMSTQTFVGKKPALAELNTQPIIGFMLFSPIVDNYEMACLQADQTLNTHVVDITYVAHERNGGLQAAITRIQQQCVELVRQGATLLVLSDLQSDHDRAPVPPVLIANMVDQALLKAGLRRNVSLALQAGGLISGRDMAQAISIGGVDIINPYLGFVPDQSLKLTPSEFKERCESYKEMLRQEVLGFMARMGISSVSAYRGTKGFTAIGLDADLAELFGVKSVLGGLGLRDLWRILLTNHRLPRKKGIGKYEWNGQPPRKKIWGPTVTPLAIRVARGEIDLHAEMERQANLLKVGTVRGWLRLVEPMIWSEHNPMTVCILGGGAAGFYLAQSLLDSDLPIKIIIIEQRHGNKFGLVGDGIAPDHVATKRQAEVLSAVLDDPRVQYIGGIKVGRDVTLKQLKKQYACLVDASGAAVNIKLNVPGESLHAVVSADLITKAYNEEFDPFNESDWPLVENSKNPNIGIIGNGNVAADLARIFLKDPDELEGTKINPVFLRYLRQEGLSVVRIFARGNPSDCKIGLKELKELEGLGISIETSFDSTGIDRNQLTKQQQEVYDYFLRIRDKPMQVGAEKRLHFYFQLSIKEFYQDGNDLAAVFVDRAQKEQRFRMRNCITAIGKRPLADIERPEYIAGWATGQGGSLLSAQESADQAAKQIIKDFKKGKFHNTVPPATEQPWMLLSSVGNTEFKNILRWLKVFPFRTVEDFSKAKNYQPEVVSEVTPAAVDVVQTIPAHDTVNPAADEIAVTEGNNKPQLLKAPAVAANLLSFLKTNLQDKAPKDECDGKCICGTCAVKLSSPTSSKIQMTTKERELLKANSHDPKNSILSCKHTTAEVVGMGISYNYKRR